MTSIYETRTQTIEKTVWVRDVCDYCKDMSTDIDYLIPIRLEVNRGEEFGATWTKHACDRCFQYIAESLAKALVIKGGLLGDDYPPVHMGPDSDM